MQGQGQVDEDGAEGHEHDEAAYAANCRDHGLEVLPQGWIPNDSEEAGDLHHGNFNLTSELPNKIVFVELFC